MGNKSSRRSKQERDQETRTLVQERQAKIARAMESAATSPNVVIHAQEAIIANTAILQLERGGDPFTKADYVAILARLNPNNATLSQVEEMYRHYTCDELRVAIRALIYDVAVPEEDQKLASPKTLPTPTTSAVVSRRRSPRAGSEAIKPKPDAMVVSVAKPDAMVVSRHHTTAPATSTSNHQNFPAENLKHLRRLIQ